MSAAALERPAVRRVHAVLDSSLALALACILGGRVCRDRPAGPGRRPRRVDRRQRLGRVQLRSSQPRVARDAAGLLHVGLGHRGPHAGPQAPRPSRRTAPPGPSRPWPRGGGRSTTRPSCTTPRASAPFLVFAGGIRASGSGDSHEGLNWWTSADGSARGPCSPALVSGPGGTAYGSDVSAVAHAVRRLPDVVQHLRRLRRIAASSTAATTTSTMSATTATSRPSRTTRAAGKLWVAAAYNADRQARRLWIREVDQATGARRRASVAAPPRQRDRPTRARRRST